MSTRYLLTRSAIRPSYPLRLISYWCCAFSSPIRPTHRSYGWALWCALDHMYSHIYQLDEAAVRLTGLGTASVLPPPAGYASGRPAVRAAAGRAGCRGGTS